jgi:hypothetical protein
VKKVYYWEGLIYLGALVVGICVARIIEVAT